MNIQKIRGGGGQGGMRVDVSEELKFCENSNKNPVDGSGWKRGQGGCERRIEVFMKMQKRSRGEGGRVWGGVAEGGGRCER